MKSVFSTLLILFACNFAYSQCSIFGPSGPPVNQTFTYSISSSLAQCSSCHDWDVSGNALIIGSDMGSSAQIRRTGTGGYTISVSYINEGGCQSCSFTVPPLSSGCAFTVSINQQYFLGIGNVGIAANTIPQVGSSATYNWTVTYQNGATNSSNSSSPIGFFPATTANKIVSATVTVNFNGCSATTTTTFFNPIPETNGGFGKAHSGLGGTDFQSNEQKFTLYPNPTGNSIQIQGEEKSNYTISVFDVTGKHIIKNQQLGQSHSLESAAPGVYLYEITDKKGFRQEGRIVKE